jgi:hypothetical protein
VDALAGQHALGELARFDRAVFGGNELVEVGSDDFPFTVAEEVLEGGVAGSDPVFGVEDDDGEGVIVDEGIEIEGAFFQLELGLTGEGGVGSVLEDVRKLLAGKKGNASVAVRTGGLLNGTGAQGFRPSTLQVSALVVLANPGVGRSPVYSAGAGRQGFLLASAVPTNSVQAVLVWSESKHPPRQGV